MVRISSNIFKTCLHVLYQYFFQRQLRRDAHYVYTNTRSCPSSCQRNDDLTLKKLFSASNFENRTIIKEDMVKNVTEGQICSDRAGADLCVTPNSCSPNFGQWASLNYVPNQNNPYITRPETRYKYIS